MRACVRCFRMPVGAWCKVRPNGPMDDLCVKSSGLTDGAMLQVRGALRRSGFGPIGMALLGPLIVVAISLCRSPDLMAQGHLWAEDAFFLPHMLEPGPLWSKGLFIYNGHLELLNNLVFAAASHLRLKMIPLATSYCGLFVECALAFLVVLRRQDLEIGLFSALSISALVVVSPCSAEHQLNMLNSVWTSAGVLLVMISLPKARLERHKPSVAATAVFLGLSGIPALSLTPVAVMHAAAWRSRPHALIAAALTLCGVVQAALLVTHGTPNRFGSVSFWVYLAAPFFHVLVEHLIGIEATSALGHWFQQSIPNTAAVSSLMLAPIALLGWICVHIARSRDLRSRLLLATFLYVVTFNTTFAIGDRNDLFSIYDMRYFFVPSLCLALLVARTGDKSPRWPSRAVLCLLAFVTVLSAKDYFWDGYNGMYVTRQRDWRRDVDNCGTSGGPCRVEVDPGGYYAVDIPVHAAR